jgi:mono/diheme cytochrome c family protein
MFKQVKYTRFIPAAALLVGAVIVLAACASQPAATPAGQAAVPATAVPAQATSASANVPTEAAPGASDPAAPAKGTVSFATDLAPILQDSCVSCHGGEKTSKGLDLKTYASLMTGSQNGAVIVAGDAANSKLVQKIQSGSMPKRGTKWTAAQLQLLVDWVNAGAQNN